MQLSPAVGVSVRPRSERIMGAPKHPRLETEPIVVEPPKQTSGKTDYHCKETLFIQQLQPALSANVSSEKPVLNILGKLFHCVTLQTVSV